MEVDDSVDVQQLTMRIWEYWFRHSHKPTRFPLQSRMQVRKPWPAYRTQQSRTDFWAYYFAKRTEFQLVLHLPSGGLREVHSDERAHLTAVQNARDT
ncbi:hypothetical protein JAAARDRAFT_42915, partial [Jaapia argillacea MUCL 33604]